MSETSNKRAVKVGIFIFLGIVFLAAAILVIGNIHQTFSKKIKVNTFFNDVNGLQKGNNIWFSGVKIGTVKKVEFFGTSQVKVIMNIDENAQQYIRRDAKVKVSTDGLIGNKILMIYGGTASAGEINAGDTLGVEKTVSSEDMMNTLQQNNKNVLDITNDFKHISKKLADGDGTLGKLINDETVYNNIDKMTASLQNASRQAEALLGSLSTFSAKLNKKGTLANSLVTDTTTFKSIKETIAELNKISDTAAVFVSDLKKASNNPKTPLGIMLKDEEAGSNLKATLKNLEGSSKKLDEDLEGLQHSFLLKRYFKKKDKTK
ncbi:MAG: MlaD family protein [Bacteroidia bacterium]